MPRPKGDDPLFLAFDTSGPWIAAALFEDDVQLSARFIETRRGQAEALVPTLEALLNDCSVTFDELAAIGVGVGPGNFTGIRISVALARGLAMSLDLPTCAVTAFDLMRDPSGPAAAPALLLSVQGPRDQVYVQSQRYGKPDSAPLLIDPDAPPEHLRRVNLHVRGASADRIAKAFDAPFENAILEDIPYRLGKHTSWTFGAEKASDPPSPLYIRPPDAAPASDPPPVILP